ncbi:nuclear valosin-containing protein-like isoform X2 [Drosophila ficusphila]|uniref:nuclear valosin-containing protein-like isoform X2 n=1 Tax=Drosophila ficusphila TaxID=30025 RepID=UPI0007E6E187|nr:nuclear valosin-containing protein-like isoform X2 [Drosophila ficusphila]
MKKNKPLLHDHLITIRVKKYLEEHIGETYLDVKQMTRELMQKYPEYSRRKFGPFRQLVHQAFSIISDSYNLDKVSSSEDECVSEEFEAPPVNSVMNNMMNSLYSQPLKPLAAKPISEPIDISSGDDNDDDSNTKTTNGEVPTPAPPSAQPNALKRLMEELPESTVVAKKSKPNSTQGGCPDSAHKYLASGPRGKKPSEDSGPRKDHRNAPGLYQQLHQNQNQNLNRDRPRKYKKELDVQHTTESFRDIGGMDSTLKELCEMLIHIKSPEFYFQLGLLPSRGLLLHGPPGCGKTFLARAISGQLKMPLLEVPATELIGGISGESEQRIREVFDQAIGYSPCVLFIDEIDAIGGNRQWAAKDMERRIVSQLISSLDNLKTNEFGQSVVVIGATTRPDVLDPGLRRVGRFDHEIAIHIPSRKERREILRIQCEGLSVDPKLNYDKIAELTPGYVGADLMALVSRAASVAVKRRSMKKFRELHAASEKNMTTVTLDDDEPIEEPSDKAEKEAEAKSKPDKNPEKEDEAVAKDDGEKNPTEKDKEAKEVTKDDGDKNPTKEETTKEDKSKPETPKKETNGKSPQKSKDTAMEVDEEALKTPEKPEKPKEQTADSSNNEYYEPTLAELTNFLDNPPEEFADPNFCLTLIDFVDAIKVMQPSAKREGFVTVPDTTWDDIGALQDIRDELKLAVLAPVKYPEMLDRLGLNAPSGVLLCGPPGCGKTLLAKAIANEAGINFISVKGPELMNMYVGESERAVRACFQRARNSAPCVIFFDEFDSLCPKRSDGGDGNNSGTRIVNQLLTEMDGVEERKGVYILAATNRPDIIDPAILRPGRLDTILYVGLPEKSERAEILKATTKNGKRPVLAEDVDLDEIAAQTEGYTGADLAGLVKQASMYSLRQSLNNGDTKLDDLCVRSQHFKEALQQLRPSVSEKDRKIYDKLRMKYAAPRVPTFDDK